MDTISLNQQMEALAQIPGITNIQIDRIQQFIQTYLRHSRIEVVVDYVHGYNVLASVCQKEAPRKELTPAELYDRTLELFANELPKGIQVYVRTH